MAHIPLDVIVASAKAHGVESGYLWLYLNGYKRRVPSAICEKIQCDILGIDGCDVNGLHTALALQQENIKEDVGTE